jgi:TIR domain
MNLIETLEVTSSSTIGRIELLVGDLTDIPDDHRVDVLVISAFPGDYSPTQASLIGALTTKGLNVDRLSRNPEADLRRNFSCWISQEISPSISGLSFRRLLCFEPAVRGSPPELVGDIFRALAPFVYAEPAIRSMAMPILAAGDQGYSISTMLPPLLDAAKHWLTIGFPIHTIKLVVRSESALPEVLPILRKYRASEVPAVPRSAPSRTSNQTNSHQPGGNLAQYEVFISYSRVDEDAASHLATHLGQLGLRVFLDRSEIDIGASWQQKIFDALEGCSITVVLYSPDYVQSKVCKEEFNISWARRRETGRDLIFPLLISDAELPTYMRMLNYVDCRVKDKAKIASAATVLASTLRPVDISAR